MKIYEYARPGGMHLLGGGGGGWGGASVGISMKKNQFIESGISKRAFNIYIYSYTNRWPVYLANATIRESNTRIPMAEK